MLDMPPVIQWFAMIGVLALVGLAVLITSGIYTRRARRSASRSRIRELLDGPAAAEPERTGAYLHGRVSRLTESLAVVALTGPGNNGQSVVVPDTGQYVVGDRVTLYQYDDGTPDGMWRPETGTPVWDKVMKP